MGLGQVITSVSVSTPESTSALVLRALAVLAIAGLARFWQKMHQARMLTRGVATKYGIPLLPHSYLFGHLVIIGKTMARCPVGFYGSCMTTVLLEEYPQFEDVGVFYLDMWPVAGPMMYVFHPGLMSQYMGVLPKGDLLIDEFGPFTGNRDLVTSEGDHWKRWRTLFNPGFSSRNLMTMVPAFLEETRVFIQRLRKTAETGEVIRLEDGALSLTLDIIGRATLGTRLHTQTGKHPVHKTLDSQIGWLVNVWDPPGLLNLLNPFRRLFMWRNNRFFRNFFTPLIHQLAAEHSREVSSPAKTKTIVSLAVEGYLAGTTHDPASPTPPRIDDTFIDDAAQQLVVFLFAGHDTTGTTLSFAYHLLHSHRDKLAALRAELDAVFGEEGDAEAVEARIRQNPQLLNQLPYCTAVIKETLRLHPPAGSLRQGAPGFFLTHPDSGVKMPTEDFALFAVSATSQRWARYWPEPHAFIPERWLHADKEEGNDKRMQEKRNAYRPFEIGHRGCIGQELAMLELRMVLALTLREFDVESCYPEDGPTIWGDKAYQVMLPGQVTGHPAGGLPARVRVAHSVKG